MSPTRSGRAPSRGFTLMELLIVVGLLSALAIFFTAALGGGGKAVALESGQVMLANLVTAARARAVASGRPIRILVRNQTDRDDYRRLLILIQLRASTLPQGVAANWETIEAATLPAGVYLLPDTGQIVSGMLPNPSRWIGGSRNPLRSSVLENTTFSYNYDGRSEAWEYCGFTAMGTNETNAGDLVLSSGRARPPDTTSGSSPVELTDPDTVRGVSLSTYGVVRLIHDRAGF